MLKLSYDNKHLTLSNRMEIEKELDKGTSLINIAKLLNKDPRTIAKEIKNRRTIKYNYKNKINGNKDCINIQNCEVKRLCGGKCSELCKRCINFDCQKKCSRYKERVCPKLLRFPYTCNSCNKKQSCMINYSFYKASDAQDQYKTLLTTSRSGYNLTSNEYSLLDNVIKEGSNKGQSLKHICTSNKQLLPCSERTVYRYIDDNILSTKNIDLPRKVKMKKRVRRKEKFNMSKEERKGREYMDFLKFLAINPGVFFVQFDLVQGLQSIDEPFIMTIHFPHTRLMLGYLIENKTTREVVEVFNYLESRLGINGFKNLFPCTITDRGNEFNNFLGIESSIETGEKRTTVFYCDAYASHQKGAIENNHTLVRRIIPKGTSFSSLTQSKVNLMMSHINSYVRRVNGDKTPYQIFESIYGQETLKKLGITKIPSDQVTLNSSLLK